MAYGICLQLAEVGAFRCPAPARVEELAPLVLVQVIAFKVHNELDGVREFVCM